MRDFNKEYIYYKKKVILILKFVFLSNVQNVVLRFIKKIVDFFFSESENASRIAYSENSFIVAQIAQCFAKLLYVAQEVDNKNLLVFSTLDILFGRYILVVRIETFIYIYNRLALWHSFRS